MSLRKTARIDCDGPDCLAGVDGINGAQARAWARQRGWLIRNKTDLCPVCRPATREAQLAQPRPAGTP